MVSQHLCQPNDCTSCAACCGIYNYVENTRDALVTRFIYRGKMMEKVRSGEISLDDYRDVIRRREDHKRIYTTIYTCEFVGFLNKEQTKVGCMLHPYQNNGDDLRTISFYGRDICDGHFCPSYEKLAAHEATIILDCVKDWYLYGAVITDIDFVKSFFRIVETSLGEALKPAIIAQSHKTREAFLNYCNLKVDWGFRDTTRPRFGKYFFVGEGYDIDCIDYASLGAEKSPYDAIFLSLASRFCTKDELELANGRLAMLIDTFINEYTNAYNKNN